jgi:hypothetical protein
LLNGKVKVNVKAEIKVEPFTFPDSIALMCMVAAMRPPLITSNSTVHCIPCLILCVSHLRVRFRVVVRGVRSVG